LKKTYGKIALWTVIAGVTAGAFLGGKELRSRQEFVALSGTLPVQASALLKLTPEQPPVKIDSMGTAKGDTKYRDLLNSVLKLIQAHYVEKITPEVETKLARGAVQGMLDVIGDPDTRFVDPKETKLLDDAATGRFHGIGAILALKREGQDDEATQKVVVVAPMPGSPAEKSGLLCGDTITDVGGKWVIAYDPGFAKLRRAIQHQDIDRLEFKKSWEAAESKLKGGLSITDALEELTTKTSGETTLTVERTGVKDPIEVKLLFHETRVDPVTSSMLNKNVGYLRIAQFNQQAASKFAAEVAKVRGEGAKALVLDLRNCPGGLLDVATSIAAQFTGGGTVAIIREQNGRRPIRVTPTKAFSMPVAILVNGGTASVAELVAGTLRESRSATLVGTQTFGDGLVQTPLVLRDKSAALVTTGKMLTPKGVDFTGVGLKPDKEVRPGDSGSDAQLNEARRLVESKLSRGRA